MASETKYEITSDLFGDGGESTFKEIADMVKGWQYEGWDLSVETSGYDVRIYANRTDENADSIPSRFVNWVMVTDDYGYLTVATEIIQEEEVDPTITPPQYVVIEFNDDKAAEINKLMDAKDFDGLLAHPHEITSTYPSSKGFHPNGYQILKPLDGILWLNRTHKTINVKTDFGYDMAMSVAVMKFPFDTTPDLAICFRIK